MWKQLQRAGNNSSGQDSTPAGRTQGTRRENQPVLRARSNPHNTHKSEPLIVHMHPPLAGEEPERGRRRGTRPGARKRDLDPGGGL